MSKDLTQYSAQQVRPLIDAFHERFNEVLLKVPLEAPITRNLAVYISTNWNYHSMPEPDEKIAHLELLRAVQSLEQRVIALEQRDRS